MTDQQQDTKPPKTNILQVIGSVLAAGFGVQSAKNKERDFQQGSFKAFAIAGFLFTVLFIVIIASIAFTVLENVGQ